MAKEQKTFVAGRMNKSVDERLLPEGEYVDGQNIRLGSTELSEIGAVENTKGNVQLTTLQYKGDDLSGDAVCIGAFDDSAEETMYWFVHDPANTTATGGVVDMIVSFNTQTQQLTYHVITTELLNFNPTYLVNGVDKIDDLLFFTDDYNEPRKINVTRGYPQPNASHVDQIVELDISVIKPQPMEAPEISLVNNESSENFMEDSFICFAYRYKYRDGEYSATSQFSQPSFVPSRYILEPSTMNNEGMKNSINSATVSFNTGVENVIGIDILYKLSDSNVIYVAKKLNKSANSIPNNSTSSITFSNGDIYTILSEGEILRLYDNVPRLAKAQTIMGNRIMYGNYLEGRDLIDDNEDPVVMNYYLEGVSSNGIIESDSYTVSSQPYGLAGTTGLTSNSRASIDINSFPFDYYQEGSELTVEIRLTDLGIKDENGTDNPNYTPSSDPITLYFSYTVTEDIPFTIYPAYQAYYNADWLLQTGTFTYQQSVADWSSGVTFTDVFNDATQTPSPVNQNVPELEPLRSARDSVITDSPNTDPVTLIITPTGTLRFIPNAIQYREIGNINEKDYYQLFDVEYLNVSVSSLRTSRKSLHSNRDYQVGIVYQDAEGRQTTAFESLNNTIHFGAEKSIESNSIKAIIPSNMHPPKWADRYKFVAKQTETDYETIYSSIYYRDTVGYNSWLKLEGEQYNKVSTGQELIVKRDSNGPLDDVVKATVLEVKSVETDFLVGNNITEPSGVYAKFLPDGWSLDYTASSILGGQTLTGSSIGYPSVRYPVFETDNNINTIWEIPQGSVVIIKISTKRSQGRPNCPEERCLFELEVTAQNDYANLHEFWIGEAVNIASINCEFSGFQAQFNSHLYNQLLPTSATNPLDLSVEDGVHKFQFQTNPTSNEMWLYGQSGLIGCGGASKRRLSRININISVRTSGNDIIMETIPSESNGEIYYENEQSFPIVNGFHTSGNIDDDQNQTATDPAIVNLTFFNCFTFFNGAESYKIGDSIVGKKFYLGNRVTSVSEQDYKEIRREASITYSGIFNAQNNVNKLNEFNLGLANYKDCEESYGPIQVLHGRMTDLLTLQEDRISYISLGKNLLTAADGGGVLTSVPEILGTQVARIEEYGISENPESFCHYGADIYFTDAKRSAVVQLKGGSKAESLSIISDAGMRSWFRDLFQTSFDYQKLGGYDPYMDEYVLSPNTNRLPFEVPVYECGGGPILFTGLTSDYSFFFDFADGFGTVTVEGSCTEETSISVNYNGTVYQPTPNPVAPNTSYSFTVDKNIPSVTQAEFTISPTSPSSDSQTEMSVSCPVADTLRIIPICITSRADAGRSTFFQYGYSDSATGYNSYIQSAPCVFLSSNLYASDNIVSIYGPIVSGSQGTGVIPTNGSDVIVSAFRQAPSSNFVFNPNENSLRYLRVAAASPVYENNATDISNLLSASIDITPITGSDPIHTGTFVMPSGGDNDVLYLIWDFRERKELKLCYSTDVSEACCECFSSPSCVPFLGTTVELTDGAACALTPTTTYYTSTITSGGVTNTQPIVGTTVYSYLGCSSGNTVGAGFIKLTDNTWVETDSNGEVTLVGSC